MITNYYRQGSFVDLRNCSNFCCNQTACLFPSPSFACPFPLCNPCFNNCNCNINTIYFLTGALLGNCLFNSCR